MSAITKPCFISAFLNLYLFTVVVRCGIDRQQDAYLRNKLGSKVKCGLTTPNIDGRSSVTKGRIINGEKSTVRYPWLVQVWRKSWSCELDNNGQCIMTAGSINWQESVYISIGTIISDRVIVTVGHGLCSAQAVNVRYSCKDADTDKDGNQNQNRPNENEIQIRLGKTGLEMVYDDTFPTTFDDTISAYLFNYQPLPNDNKHRGFVFSENGDVGCIVKSNGLGLEKGRIYPICLPSPDTFKRKPFKVKIAGWGYRYDEWENPAGVASSCQTNEALKRADLDTDDRKAFPAFSPCSKLFTAGTEYCADIDTKLNSFSTAVGITFDNDRHVNIYKMNIRKNNKDDECQNLWPKAKKAFQNYNPQLVYEKEFEETIDRFAIKEFVHKVAGKDVFRLALTCYNVKKAGKFGICPLKEASPHYRWGFCSKSCKDKKALDENEIYEEAKFLYYERMPVGEIHASRKVIYMIKLNYLPRMKQSSNLTIL